MTSHASKERESAFKPKLTRMSSQANADISLEKATFDNNRLTLSGWCFDRTRPLSSASVVVELGGTLQTFKLKTGLKRPDVGEAYGSELGYDSGFFCSLHLDLNSDLPPRLELLFEFIGKLEPSVYQITWRRNPIFHASVVFHTIRAINLGDVKWAIGEFCRGRFLHVWNEMQKAYRDNSADEFAYVDLREALSLLKEEAPKTETPPRPVDIVIPVYNGLEHLDSLFKSLSENTETRHRIILIDDCSPDPEVRHRLRGFANSRENVTVVELKENLGFVGAANLGAALATHDFILLNTDVVVPPFWLERLIAPINQDASIASVTPFSNAATICSFPILCADNDVFNDLSVESIDRWFWLTKTDCIDIDLPTGVGFCMAVRRDAWEKIGPFDREVFKQGYGEENDWCQRAITHQYRNVICSNLYVYHKHGGSFESESRAEYRSRGYNEVLKRHPSYETQVSQYIKADVLRPIRDILSVIVGCAASEPNCHLVFDHSLGGGSNHYRERMVADLVDSGIPVLLILIRPPDQASRVLDRYQLEFYFRTLKVAFSFDSLGMLSRLLEFVSVKQIFVNSIVSDEQPLETLHWISDFKIKSGAELVLPFHDFYPLCPSYTLLDASGRYCEIPNESVCTKCLKSNTYAFNPTRSSIGEWRVNWLKLGMQADKVLCFSKSSRELIMRGFNDAPLKIEVMPHSDTVTFDHSPEYTPPSSLNIGVLGSIGYQKGAGVLADLAKVMLARDPKARITIIGSLDTSKPKRNITVTGAYRASELVTLIEQHAPSIFFLPSIWPETFSYVTQELINLRVPLVVFDIGAPAERVRSYEGGWVISLALRDDPEALYETLKSIACEVLTATKTERSYSC